MSEKEEEELPEQCKSCYWYWWIGQPPKYYCKIKSGLTANELPVPCPDYGMKEEEQQQRKPLFCTRMKIIFYALLEPFVILITFNWVTVAWRHYNKLAWWVLMKRSKLMLEYFDRGGK